MTLVVDVQADTASADVLVEAVLFDVEVTVEPHITDVEVFVEPLTGIAPPLPPTGRERFVGPGQTYTLAGRPMDGTLRAFVNGIEYEPGEDWLLDGQDVTFSFPEIEARDRVTLTYYRQEA